MKTAVFLYRLIGPHDGPEEIVMRNEIRIHGYMDKGYTGSSVMVECSIRNGFPGFDITGLPGASVREARERVRCALRSCGYKFPQSRILMNLSPASQTKDSTLLDLPLACAILHAQTRPEQGGAPAGDPIDVMVAGELSLSGRVLDAPQAMGAIEAAKNAGCSVCLVPFETEEETMDGITVFHVSNLPQAYSVLADIVCGNLAVCTSECRKRDTGVIFEDIIGLEEEKEILSMAAAGFHSTLLFGPPGVGKTMLSCRMHLLLGPYSKPRRDEVSRILGCADLSGTEGDIRNHSRMRILSHDCTQTQFVSGSSPKTPGEGALSHMGTLVLDEINKYTPKLLETVKDAYDKGYTQSTRSGDVIIYPARFLMIGNLNPCGCGALGDPNAVCTCTAQKITTHWAKLGRQLIERFDIRLPIRSRGDMLTQIDTPKKSDAYYISSVESALARQRGRYKYIDEVDYNGQIHFSTSALLCLKNEIELFNRINDQNDLSSRSQIGTIALARSIADYEDRPDVTEEDFAKAKSLRRYGLGDYYWRSLR